jgi:putative ABC transport system permease protein
LQSRSEYVASQAGQVDQIVNLMYGLLGLAVIIALVSIANSTSLSIHERTHELGLLRAVGMTRHQVASSVRWEAGIVATLGVVLGTGLAVAFGWAIAVALRHEGLLAVVVPVPALLLIAAIGVIGGVVASLRPAWRGSHLDVLQAIASE